MAEWPDDFVPRLIPDDDARALEHEDLIKETIAWWKTDAQLVALIGHRLVPEQGLDVAHSESSSEEKWEELTGKYSPGRDAVDQALLSEQQAEALRNRRMVESQVTDLVAWHQDI
jgi:hypothetical protein